MICQLCPSRELNKKRQLCSDQWKRYWLRQRASHYQGCDKANEKNLWLANVAMKLSHFVFLNSVCWCSGSFCRNLQFAKSLYLAPLWSCAGRPYEAPWCGHRPSTAGPTQRGQWRRPCRVRVRRGCSHRFPESRGTRAEDVELRIF